MTENTQIIGTYISPYVRKVLAVLHLKDIPYDIDPIVPFYGNDEFSKMSPLRRIPVLSDDQVTIADSTVICEYLEERYPQPPLFPTTLSARARMRWLEEYADTRMGEVFIWQLFNQSIIKRSVWGEEKSLTLLSLQRRWGGIFPKFWTTWNPNCLKAAICLAVSVLPILQLRASSGTLHSPASRSMRLRGQSQRRLLEESCRSMRCSAYGCLKSVRCVHRSQANEKPWLRWERRSRRRPTAPMCLVAVLCASTRERWRSLKLSELNTARCQKALGAPLRKQASDEDLYRVDKQPCRL